MSESQFTKTSDPVDPETVNELRALIEESEPQGFDSFIRQYVHDGLERLKVLQAAAASLDASALEDAAHAIKGSSANFGAKDMMSLCLAVEMDARKKDAVAAGARVPPIIEEFGRVQRALEAMCMKPLSS